MTLTLGLDLSLTSPAIAHIRDGAIIRVSNIKTTGRRQASLKHPDGASTHDRHARIIAVRAWAYDDIKDYAPDEIDLAVVEAPAVGSTMGSMHDRSGLWWQIVDVLREYGVTVVEVSPAGRCKYITGHGRKDKKVVLAHAIERYADHMPPGERIKNDDIADAIGLADMGARRLGCPVVPDDLMPEANLAAMDGVLWPI